MYDICVRVKPLVGLGCSPVLVNGAKKMFLKWIGRALRQRRIQFPESNGSVRWRLARNLFRLNETDVEIRNEGQDVEQQ